ncbi:hypothetical protein CL629_02885 [bacterium]|nr:hypothetical protein [bacterium]|tara:strand:- start:3348 stop:4094 length:747 start_codon:yes stop_codon:yes gene_type:complete
MNLNNILTQVKVSKPYIKIKENPIMALPLIAIAIVLVVFWQAIFVLALIGIIIAVILKFYYSGPTLKELMARKRTLLSEINILEKEYMKRRISKTDFLEAFRKKHTKLIGLEALIDEKYNKEKLPKKDSRLKEITTKKRHLVNEVLGDKKRTLKEMEIAQKLYLKRRIDAATYQDIIKKKQQRLIEFEAHLKQIYGEESISTVMVNLRKRLDGVEIQRSKDAVKKRIKTSRKERDIAEEIAEQLKYIN